MGQMIEKGNTQKRKPMLTIIIKYIHIYVYIPELTSSQGVQIKTIMRHHFTPKRNRKKLARTWVGRNSIPMG